LGQDQIMSSLAGFPNRGCVVRETRISRSGSANGSGRSSSVSTALKIAVVDPIPSARMSTATRVNPGLRRSVRNP
jgi:hypothetical protein